MISLELPRDCGARHAAQVCEIGQLPCPGRQMSVNPFRIVDPFFFGAASLAAFGP